MRYDKVRSGIFLERLNRFVALAEIDGKKTTVHVKNTGRCKELFVPYAKAYFEESTNSLRKTKYDIIAIEKETGKGKILINIDCQVANKVAEEWLREGNIFSKDCIIETEKIFGASRLDLYVTDGECRAYVEVKSVTLERNGIVKFPDAPTERGLKHINELCHAVDAGYEAYLIFVIQMEGAKCFMPNYDTHAEFGYALRNAIDHGVNVVAVECHVECDLIVPKQRVLTSI